MSQSDLIIIGLLALCVVGAIVIEVTETIQKWLGVKQEQLKAPPPRQPVVILQREEEPRTLQPKVSNGTPALTPRRGGGDGQGNP